MNSASLESINHFFVHYPIFTISIGVSALIGTFIYLLGFSRYMGRQFKRSRMKHRIDHLKDHYIICGYGRVGQQIVKELVSEKEHFVIIEREEEKLKSAKEHDWPYLQGDVALDESLFE